MTREKALESAVLSLLDIVEEISQGLANDLEPTTEWANVVSKVFAQHYRDIREAE